MSKRDQTLGEALSDVTRGLWITTAAVSRSRSVKRFAQNRAMEEGVREIRWAVFFVTRDSIKQTTVARFAAESRGRGYGHPNKRSDRQGSPTSRRYTARRRIG